MALPNLVALTKTSVGDPRMAIRAENIASLDLIKDQLDSVAPVHEMPHGGALLGLDPVMELQDDRVIFSTNRAPSLPLDRMSQLLVAIDSLPVSGVTLGERPFKARLDFCQVLGAVSRVVLASRSTHLCAIFRATWTAPTLFPVRAQRTLRKLVERLLNPALSTCLHTGILPREAH